MYEVVLTVFTKRGDWEMRFPGVDEKQAWLLARTLDKIYPEHLVEVAHQGIRTTLSGAKWPEGLPGA
jgi:hypothetical protein